MVNIKQMLLSNEENEAIIKSFNEGIQELDRAVTEAQEFFNYVRQHNLGIEKLQPHIRNLNEFVEHNKRVLQDKIKELSAGTPEEIERIEQYEAMLKGIEAKMKKLQEEAQEAGVEIEIAGDIT